MTLTRKVDVTGGALLPSIVKFAIPLMVGSIVQILFNAIDIAVLGHMADTNAVASVGVTSAVTGLLINAFIGFSMGTNILLARHLGAKDRENTRKVVDTSIIGAFCIGLVVAVIGFIVSPLLLSLIDCPAECREGAVLYLRIYLCATPAILVYNFGSAVIRVSGDTQKPLYYIIASGLLNVVLNIILCLILPQKVAAVAIATLASQILSAVLVIIHLIRMEGDCRMDLRRMVFEPHTLGRIVRYGFPTAITHSLYSIPNLMIQSSINSFGPAAISGNTSAANLESMLNCFYTGFGTAAMTFVGQNLGAGRSDRVKRAILYCLIINVTVGSLLGVGSTLFGEPLLRLYLPHDESAVAYGLVRLKHVALFLGVAAFNNLLSNSMNAFGYPVCQTACGLFSVLGLRIIWMLFLFPLRPSIDMLYFCFTVSWCVQMVLLLCCFCFIYRKFRKGTLHQI